MPTLRDATSEYQYYGNNRKTAARRILNEGLGEIDVSKITEEHICLVLQGYMSATKNQPNTKANMWGACKDFLEFAGVPTSVLGLIRVKNGQLQRRCNLSSEEFVAVTTPDRPDPVLPDERTPPRLGRIGALSPDDYDVVETLAAMRELQPGFYGDSRGR